MENYSAYSVEIPPESTDLINNRTLKVGASKKERAASKTQREGVNRPRVALISVN